MKNRRWVLFWVLQKRRLRSVTSSAGESRPEANQTLPFIGVRVTSLSPERPEVVFGFVFSFSHVHCRELQQTHISFFWTQTNPFESGSLFCNLLFQCEVITFMQTQAQSHRARGKKKFSVRHKSRRERKTWKNGSGQMWSVWCLENAAVHYQMESLQDNLVKRPSFAQCSSINKLIRRWKEALFAFDFQKHRLHCLQSQFRLARCGGANCS